MNKAKEPHETFTDRSPLGISLMLLMAKIPGLAKRTNHTIAVAALQREIPNEQSLYDLTNELHILRNELIAWRRDLNTTLIYALDSSDDSTKERNMQGADKRYELLGVSLVIHMHASRMLVSLSPPGDRSGLLLEDEVQALATELKQIQRSVPPNERNYRACFALTQKAKVADAAIATHASFRRAAVRTEGRVIDPYVLKGFCEALGRRCCDGKTCCL